MLGLMESIRKVNKNIDICNFWKFFYLNMDIFVMASLTFLPINQTVEHIVNVKLVKKIIKKWILTKLI